MPLLNMRELLQFPGNGDNSTDTVLNGVHFNLTTLRHFNYTIYSNNTISNNSKCYLIFDNFKPHMFSNGSWVNATTCYIPYYGIASRGTTSIVFATLFALSIMFTLVNLRKHGKLYLREDKRFRAVGRRWQWYWMLFVAGCALVSTLTGIDVDRYYLQSLPIILQGFFFVLMVPGALAMVWEATRHWGSWQERQIVDADPYGLPQDDRRAKTEFWLPLIFYLFAWLNFFMTIPKSWSKLQKQNTDEQRNTIAKPSAIGAREKAGAIFAALAWLTICYSLHHSLKHYKPRARGLWDRFNTVCHFVPTKLFLAISILGIRVGYALASAWLWDITIFKDDAEIGWSFGFGFGTVLAIIVVFEIAGYVDKNEDKILIEQRRQRGAIADSELGYVKKPSWWNRNWAERYQTDEQRLRNMTGNVGGGRATSRRISQNIEMGNMGAGVRNRSRSRNTGDSFQDQSTESYSGGARPGATRGQSNDGASTMTGQTLTGDGEAPPQRVRSMLNV